MSVSWQRWLAYAKAKLDSTLKESEAELDEREARLRAEAEGKPWLSSSSEAPTFDEMRARIEHDARQAGERRRREGAAGGPAPSRPGPRPEGGPSDTAAPAAGVSTGLGEDPLASFDMAAHEKAADERLAAIRRELGLADEAEAPDAEPPDVPPSTDGPGSPDGPASTDGPASPSGPVADDEPDDDTPVAPV